MSYVGAKHDIIDGSIENGVAISSVFDMREYNAGFVHVPSAWTDANIGFKIASEKKGTFGIARTAAGAALEISNVVTNAEGTYAFPSGLNAARWVQLWSKNTGSEADVNQGAAREITVDLKS